MNYTVLLKINFQAKIDLLVSQADSELRLLGLRVLRIEITHLRCRDFPVHLSSHIGVQTLLNTYRNKKTDDMFMLNSFPLLPESILMQPDLLSEGNVMEPHRKVPTRFSNLCWSISVNNSLN